jgi:predicted chitinase
MQLTGKESYAKYAAYVGKSIEDVAMLVRSEDRWAFDSAAWEYVIDKKLIGNSDFVSVTKAINGSVIGLAERRKYLNRLLDNSTSI